MRQGLRPEQTGPAVQLYGADAGRYTTQNSGLQHDMASLAVALLGLPPGGAPVLADIGCGSGLSSRALEASGAAWVGTDITREMLQLAASEGGCAGRLALSDFGQGLPLRPGCLDGAISISAVQWLCSSSGQAGLPPAMLRFSAALHSCLAPGAAAALQVYPQDDAQAQQLVAGALQSGLNAGLHVSFPHATAAKKLYLLAHRPLGANAPSQGAHLSQHCCSLAWPKSGSCLLSWKRYLQQQGRPLSPDLLAAIGRMHQEHAAAGKHMLRLLRRAEALSQPSAGSAAASSGGTCGSTNADSSSTDVVLQAEVQLVDHGLQPCGGPIHVQLTAALELLGSGGEPDVCTHAVERPQQVAPAAAEQPQSGGSAASAAAAAIAGSGSPPSAATGPYSGCVPAAIAAAQSLLAGGTACSDGGSRSSRGEVLHAAVKAAEGAVQHAQHAPLQPFLAPPAGSSLNAHQFMRLEPLEPSSLQPGAAASLVQGRRQRPLAAVLHAHKAAQHLALRFSCEAAPCGKCSNSSSSSGGSGGTCGSLSCCAHVASCMRGFCAGENASVVAVDGQLHPGRHDSTWLLYVAGLQHRDRADLAAALDRHFA